MKPNAAAAPAATKPPKSATFTPVANPFDPRQPIGFLPPSAAALALANQPGVTKPPPKPQGITKPKDTPTTAAIDLAVNLAAPMPLATLDCSPIGEAMADTVGIRPSAGVVIVTGALSLIPFVPANVKVKALKFASKAAAPVVGTGIGCAAGRKITQWWRRGAPATAGAARASAPATGAAAPAAPSAPTPAPTAV
jgi:hypothetical protein